MYAKELTFTMFPVMRTVVDIHIVPVQYKFVDIYIVPRDTKSS